MKRVLRPIRNLLAAYLRMGRRMSYVISYQERLDAR